MDTTTLMSKLPELLDWVEKNPLFLTVTSSGVAIWLIANLKSMFSMLAAAAKALISFEITNTYEDARAIGANTLRIQQVEFNRLLMSSRALWERTVNLDLSDYVNDKLDTQVLYDAYAANNVCLKSEPVNAYGFSVRVLLGKLVTVHRSYKLDGQRITMNSTIRVFFASKRAFMSKLINEINTRVAEAFAYNANSQYVDIYKNNDYGSSSKKLKRSLSSIFTKGNVHLELFDSIKSFISSKDVYKKLNYPYNYCALLHGVPGSGKTSTILAIASELKRNICYVNIASINAQQLMQVFNNDTENTLYVFEDIDAVSYKQASSREKHKDEDGTDDAQQKLFGVSLSDLLNITDGLLASDGTICLFTTNYIDRLDPAFLRAGRMNKVVEFTDMTPDVANDMIEAYLGARISNLQDCIKPAELQEMILDTLLGKKTLEDLKAKFCCK